MKSTVAIENLPSHNFLFACCYNSNTNNLNFQSVPYLVLIFVQTINRSSALSSKNNLRKIYKNALKIIDCKKFVHTSSYSALWKYLSRPENINILCFYFSFYLLSTSYFIPRVNSKEKNRKVVKLKELMIVERWQGLFSNSTIILIAFL